MCNILVRVTYKTKKQRSKEDAGFNPTKLLLNKKCHSHFYDIKMYFFVEERDK